ncbi:ABC transporter substrate-binding protein [Roseomonas sp. GC11]|uniref:ABC transporter substrate-binding protein n=1 Tax=Roseomonas sp. GC11 TaxID=2950546 RepID=UPI00210BE6EA|nr:ABC transporter substrate-binding protein [Roseomonas sp. GC11]MCQ4162346.1 ABC transporter substrate-binding protein [Roseomonas sp. GC11]
MLRRSFLAGSAAAALAHPLASPALAQPAGARVLKYVPQADLTVTDPVMTTAYITRTHGLMIWDQLYSLDSNLRPQPQMVEGHVVEEGGLRWTFRLREGLVFHDGEPVRGRDCIASIRRWAQRDPLGQGLLARLAEMTAPDDRSFVIRLKRPYGAMLDALSKVGPSALFVMPERLAMTEATRPIPEIIGSGPFRWKADERVVGARVVYEKFAGYRPREGGTPSWGAGPKIVNFDRVEWHVMPDPGTAASAIGNGEVDWWENPPNDLLPVLERNRNIATMLATPLGTLGTGIFNHLYAPFDKAAVRRVVMEAMSQEDCMIAAAGTDPALRRTGVGIFTPGTPMASTADLGPITQRRGMEVLKKALVEAGYKGEKVVLMIPTDQAALAAIGEVCLDTLRRLGMNVEPAVSDWGTLVQRRASKAPPEQGGWNMFNTTWAGLDMINPAVTQVLRCNGEKAFFGWPDIPAIETLRDAWLDAPDVETQQKLCAEIQKVAMQEVPFVPTGQYLYKTAYRRSLAHVPDGLFVFWGVKRA